MKFKNIFIALGTNIGDRNQNLTTALLFLEKFFQVESESSVYESKPWGFTDQPNFLNMVIQGSTDLDSFILLNELKNCEVNLGRKPNFKYGPRQIDLDIIFYDQLMVNSENLTIPHPHYLQRDFVVYPLCEIDPGFIPPDQPYSILQLLKKCPQSEIKLYEFSELTSSVLRELLICPDYFASFIKLEKKQQIDFINQTKTITLFEELNKFFNSYFSKDKTK